MPESTGVPRDAVIDMPDAGERGTTTGESAEPLVRAIKDELFRLASGRTPVKHMWVHKQNLENLPSLKNINWLYIWSVFLDHRNVFNFVNAWSISQWNTSLHFRRNVFV
jgi:hypothetical protein